MKKETKKIDYELQFIKGVGPKRAEALAKEGILTPDDLLFYFPRSYIDRNTMSSIREMLTKIGDGDMFESYKSADDIPLYNEITVIGEIIDKKQKELKSKRKLLTLTVSDDNGINRIKVNFWNRIEYFNLTYNAGDIVAISGKPDSDDFGISFTHPEIEQISQEEAEDFRSGAILPKYKMPDSFRNARITMRQLREIIASAIEKRIDFIEETLPAYLLNKLDYPDIQTMIYNLHFPKNWDILTKSKNRAKFEELFYFQLFIAQRKQGYKNNDTAPLIAPRSALARKLYDSLPFELTGDQKKSLWDFSSDFESGKPMNRLLQGDVGSGKTIVAALAMLMAIDSGYQVAIMAPTELLAEQHYHTLTMLFENLDLEVVQLVGGLKTRYKREVLESLASGKANVIVGTHALFQNDLAYNKLGFVVIDEQHRFGVEQRASLIRLARASLGDDKIVPHILVMTATPIPRTLSMTVYGDLDVTIIREMPKNRKPIITKVSFESRHEEVYEFVRREIKNGRQAYIVYPLVEKSEKLELKSAVEHFEIISRDIFPEFKCCLMHGQMFWYEKEEEMKSFLAKESDIMVATTVIEVGIDIPNATVMIIENAERFGLSQLHQLRGRVGRGSEQSYCFLMTKDHFQYQLKKKDDETERTASIIRLRTMQETCDGFKISEVDLKLRGPGDLLGTRQTGLPEFKYADIINDLDLISLSRNIAFDLIEKDPHLRLPQNAEVKTQYYKKYGFGKSYFDIA